MRYLSLFSGIEAATQAWQPLGWECVGVSEIEPFPCAVLEHHYPDVPNLGDVTKITYEQISALGQIDLIVFGSPCQGLSQAGARKGLSDSRSNLFYAAMEIIEYAVRNNGLRFALWENVPGAFSSNKGADFTEVVKHMAGFSDLDTPENGWGKEGAAVGANGLLEWSVLDAQFFGLAQRRKRVFALIDFGDWQSRPPILLERQSLRGDTPPSRETGKNPAFTTQASPASGGEATVYAKQRIGEYKEAKAASTCSARDYKDASDLVVCHGTQDPINNNETAYCLGCNNGQENVVAHSIVVDTTPTSGGGGIVPPSIQYGSVVRRLTPLECERLQGFPDNYTQIPYRNKPAEDCPKSPRYKALGNSMAVPVMAWIGQQIDSAIQKEQRIKQNRRGRK